jgi:hypothetical protein
MKAYIFFSIHEELFHRMAERLRGRGVDRFSGFVWGQSQAALIERRGIDYDPLVIFTRDLLPHVDDGTPPDLDWLERRERELGVSIVRMLTSERHLLRGRTFTQIQRMAEVALREIGAALDRARPDFIYSEDVSCFHSYVHYVLAREHKIPFWCISSGRLPHRLTLYSSGFQRLERAEKLYREIVQRGLREDERELAQRYVATFRERPARMPGMEKRGERPSIGLADLSRLRKAVGRYIGDPHDPTVTGPLRVLRQRIERIARMRLADRARVFEPPVPGERYVFYPLHYQPEASTLVQAPLYLDQVALLRELAASLPIGHRLYVKEHVSSRGRRPISFYQTIRKIHAVRLLSPDEDTWSLIRGASAVAVITGTAGWEGLLFDKPVITFGDAFFNILPHVYRASEHPKDRWYELFRKAIFEHRPDHDALLAFIAAMHDGAFPGFFGNSQVFPHVLDDDNVQHLADAVAISAGLPSG